MDFRFRCTTKGIQDLKLHEGFKRNLFGYKDLKKIVNSKVNSNPVLREKKKKKTKEEEEKCFQRETNLKKKKVHISSTQKATK